MNDRQLRYVIDGLGGRTNGVPREDGYDITVASEVMAGYVSGISLTVAGAKFCAQDAAYGWKYRASEECRI